MYEDRKYTFDWFGFTIKIILLIIFLLVMFKLFPINGVQSVVDKVYAENINEMKEAAKSYYTVDRLPKEIGESETMTLQEMLNNKMLVEFVDKDQNYCDSFGSYVTATKTKDDEYILKVQLACGNQIDYVLETIGCYDVCIDCKKENKVTEFEYKQAVKNVTKVKGCKAGYTLNGNTCYKTINSDYINATSEYTDDSVIIIDAKRKTDISKQYTDERALDTVKEYADKIVTPSKTTYYCDSTISTSATCSRQVAHTVNVPQTCSQVYAGVRTYKPCNSCAIVTVPTYTTQCSGGGTTTSYTTENYAATVKTTPTAYSCPTDYSEELTGTDRANLKCYKNITTKVCPTDYTAEGENDNLKCYKNINVDGEYYCEDIAATLKDGKCHLKTEGGFKKYTCPTGYILEGSKCYKKSTANVSTIMVNKTVTSYDYKWSTEESIDGWTKTGNSRLVDGEKEETVEDKEYKKLVENIRNESDKEVSDRLTNVTANETTTSSDIGMIILYILLGLGILYLLFMFITIRRPRNN